MILLVDASRIFRHILQGKLTEAGFICQESVDGIDALKQFRSCQPKLVILDLIIPYMSGLTVLRLMKDINKDVQVIICTSSAQREMVVSAIRYGASDYVIKPFRITEVVDKIKRLIINQTVEGEALC